MRQLTNSQWYEQNGSIYKNVQAPDLDKKKKNYNAPDQWNHPHKTLFKDTVQESH